MQSLWFRAAQTRSTCRCTACVKIGTTIARQTTNAIGKRRRVSIGDIFTACYSTILATAAVADSNRKVRRREEWDRLIAEAKAETPTENVKEPQDCQVEGNADEVKSQTPGMPGVSGASEAPGGSGIPGTSGTSKIPGFLGNKFPFSRTGISATKVGATGPMNLNGASWMVASSLDGLGSHLNVTPSTSQIPRPVESMTPESSQNPVPHHTTSPVQLATLENTEDLERFGEHIPSNSKLQPREPKTREQLDRLETSIANLVDRLMWATNSSHIAMNFHSASSDLFLDTERMIKRVEELQQGDIPMPVYKLNPPEGEERTYLHDALKMLFKNTSPGQNSLKIILVKICYNLLISSASPNIFTYNFLIEKLTELMLHDHAQIFIDSFFNDMKFRPTSRTIQVILNHYASKNDLEGYRSVIRRMRAVDGSMKVGRRHESQLLENPRTLAWAEKNTKRLIMRNGWLQLKVPRDEDIFHTLVKTSLQITTTRQSIMYIRAALREKKKIQPELLSKAVTSCIAQLDYAAGESLLQSILEFWAENVKKPDLIELTKGSRWAIRELLYLCGIDPSRDLPQVLPVDVPRWNLGRLIFYLKIGSIRDSVDCFVARVHSLQDLFPECYGRSDYIRGNSQTKSLDHGQFGDTVVRDYLPKRFETPNQPSSQSRVDRALEILDEVPYRRSKAKKSKHGARLGRRVLLQSLESKVTLSKAHIFSIEMGLVSWYYDRLPGYWRYKYHLRLKVAPYMSVQNRIAVLEGLKRLQLLHKYDYQVNLSTQQIFLLKKEFNVIKQEREQRIFDLATQVKLSAKRINHLVWYFDLLKQRIKSERQHIRKRDLNLIENEINTSKRHIKFLEKDLILEFPQLDPERRMRKLNTILVKVNRSKHQLKLLTEDIFLSYPPLVTRRTYVGSSSDWKVVRGFRKELSFRYDPRVDHLLSAEEQEYAVVEAPVERILRFEQPGEYSSDEPKLSVESLESSVSAGRSSETFDVS